tara:strand:+ start:2672 stop:3268 length:597 start_codon:yes stop_codon:yes gene_type:complete
MKIVRPEKTILTDADGVLLDWNYAFELWMSERGYFMTGPRDVYEREVAYEMPRPEMRKLISHFNSSAAIGFLPPLRDAMYYVRKLAIEHGYVFRCITSLSKDKYACHLRTKNLKMLFGKRTFEEFVYLDTGADKDEALSEYKDSGCFWLEDKIQNAQAGAKAGLNPILVAGDFNVTDEFPRYWKWKDIYNHITTANGD